MSLVTVKLWSGLARLTGGAQEVQVEASTIGEMLDALAKAHPGLEPILKDGVSVAVDSEIVNGGRHRPVTAENDILLMQRMRGG